MSTGNNEKKGYMLLYFPETGNIIPLPHIGEGEPIFLTLLDVSNYLNHMEEEYKDERLKLFSVKEEKELLANFLATK